MFIFEKSNYLSRNTTDKLDDFFNEQDIVTSVVRESLQNILDAPAEEGDGGKAVKARFSFKDIPWENFRDYATTNERKSLNDHLNSPTLDRHAQSFENQPIRTLLIEDYNTRGLTGSFDKDEPNSDSNLVNFWWNSGKGNKGRKGSNGSAGVGKICFISASGMRTMWGLSKRLNDEVYPKILIGTTDLPVHHVDAVSYKGGAQYGVEFQNPETNQTSLQPITDDDEICKFESCFGADRVEPGLSVIIPAVSEEITPKTLVSAVLKQYFWAIINEKLVVEIVSENGEISVLEPSSLAHHLQPQAGIDRLLAKKVELAINAKDLLKSSSQAIFKGLVPEISENSETYTFLKTQMTDSNLETMRDYFDQGEMIRLEFLIPFTDLTVGEQKNGLLNLFFKRLEANEEAPKEFIRRSVSLTQMEKALARSIPKNVYCFLLIDDPDMSDFVVSAEDPAHIKLTKGQFIKNRSFSPTNALSFVTEIEKIVYAILNRSDEESEFIENFDQDIFSIRLPDSKNQGEQENKPKTKQKTKQPRPDIKQKSEPIFLQRELTGETGFEVTSLKSLEEFVESGTVSLPISLQIKSAYQTISGPTAAWRYYSKHDFEMGKDIKIDLTPKDKIKIMESDGNNLKLEINSPSFKIMVTGFDENRDLITKVKVGD